METRPAAEPAAGPQRERRVYWFLRNSAGGIKSWAGRHRKLAIFSGLGLLAGLLLWRPYLHPYILEVRKLSFVLLLLAPCVALLWFLMRRLSWKLKVTAVVALVIVAFLFRHQEMRVYEYVKLYYRYATLELGQLDELPLTDHERIQPLNSVYSLAHEVMTETESPRIPDFVRIGDDYRWSMAIEPAYPIPRMFGAVREVFSLPGTTPSPSFSKDNRVPVRFDVGENLLLSHHSRTAVVRAFGPLRFLSYEPSSVTYVTDDDGEWVQIVSLIRWKGFLFPRPEFGGVQVIRQSPTGFLRSFRRVLRGVGEWVPPDEISKYRFLAGQNVLSYEVSRFIANSLRFQNGFWAPFPGYHRGDIRIPDLPADVNDQPFTGYFELKSGGGTDKLYHYFALEPFDPDKQGLNTSLFVPADGQGKTLVYRHHQLSGSLTGVSAISAKVMESRKNYDWSRNRPVEHRPYIRHIGGKKRFFWLTTVVTFKEDTGEQRFIAGSVPDVVLTDAAFNTPVWVDPLVSSGWERELNDRLQELWASD